MPGHTAIEWTNSTWNPVTGCTKVSRGCDNCYAHTLAHRRLNHIYRRALPVVDTDANRADPFAVRLWPERLTQPTAWREPRMIFVNSMSDLFHADVPDEYVRRIFEVMVATDHHVYQVLTKRPARAARFLRKHPDFLRRAGVLPKHIWIGASVEDKEAVHRVNHLRNVPAAVRFLSCEPLLGPLRLELTGIHWVIVGGESGSNHRPMEEAWALAIRDTCVAAKVPFFFKQWGGRTPKSGGRVLSRKTWNQFPRAALRLVG